MLHSILSSALEALPPGQNPGNHSGDWVGPRVGRGVLEKMESVALSGSQTPVRSARNLEKMESVALSGSQTPVRSARNLIRGGNIRL